MLLAQDGSQPTDKITEALNADLIDGVILCPKTHAKDKLEPMIKELRTAFPKKQLLLDPNFHVFALSADRLGRLESYPFFKDNLRRTDFTSDNIKEFVQQTIDYQMTLGLDYIISPGVIMSSFDGAWSQIGLQLYQESIQHLKTKDSDKKLLLCLPIGESALREDEQLNDYLDVLTTLDCTGYYIFIERSTTNAPQWSDPETLAGLMYFVNALSRNDYEVHVGYTDIVGILLTAVGARSISNGWWKSLKQFTKDRYFDQGFSNRPRITYTSLQLLNSIFINPELQQISEIGSSGEVLSGDDSDQKLETDPANQSWTSEEATMHHWKVIRQLITEIDAVEDVNGKLNLVKEKIEIAQSLYTKLRAEGVDFESISGPTHLRVWLEAITLFEQNSQ